jgi:hypothetical protein
MLSCPHLMLTDAGGDNGLRLVRDLTFKFFDNFLGFEQLSRSALFICEREVLLPRLDLVHPLFSRGMFNQWDEGGKVLGNLAEDRDGGVDDLVDIFRLDFEVDDTTAAFLGCCSCSGCKFYPILY